jgi:hypothetical protein
MIPDLSANASEAGNGLKHRQRHRPRHRCGQGSDPRRRRVACGRLYVYELAAAGAQGMVRLFEILEDETRISLSLLGVTGYPRARQNPTSARRVKSYSRMYRAPSRI